MTLAPVDHTEKTALVRVPASYGAEEKARGAVYTRESVVNFMLDLIGYTTDRPLHELRLLEPSSGEGRFVLAAATRVVESWRASGGDDIGALRDTIRAVELDNGTVSTLRSAIKAHLRDLGIGEADAAMLATCWIINNDFLLAEFAEKFDFVIGNPPYVRQEMIPSDLLKVYRRTFKTMVGRADLYIAFMEKALDLLAAEGQLSFICADAWVKNDYGRAIRKKISESFHLSHYVDMYGLDAFEASVGAYTSITVIKRSQKGPVRIAHARSVDADDLKELRKSLRCVETETSEIVTLDAINGAAPWLLSTQINLAAIQDLEARFSTLAEAGCRIGIGVATGADKAFIAPYDKLDVEESRKLPLATNKDVPSGKLRWSGKGIINPWRDEGGLVDLSEYPKLAHYLEPYRDQLEKRHTAKSDTSTRWYRTIDRITPSLTYTPKLLIPDIKGDGDAIAFDPGTLYPHHNLYFITSDTWNLRALQALLRSGIAKLFVSAYSVKIGGGYLRFQAQNLRRIRVPNWDAVGDQDRITMINAGEAGQKLDIAFLERIYGVVSGSFASLGEER